MSILIGRCGCPGDWLARARGRQSCRIPFVQKRVVSDPEEVPRGCGIKGIPGRYRMREKKVSTGKRERKTLHKSAMAVRQCLVKFSGDIAMHLGIVSHRRCHPV